MFGLGAIGFSAPWVLLALASLPAIWWLVRLTPPAPRETRFPALRLLLDIAQRQETPERTPWWLILLRLVLAGLVIVGLAGPVLNPVTAGGTAGPLLIVIDDGWAAAAHWRDRMEALAPRIAAAEAADRPIRLLTTAAGAAAPAAPALLTRAQVRGEIAALQPKPWAADRRAAIAALDALPADAVSETLWLADGVDDGAAADFAARLTAFGPVIRLDLPAGTAALALGAPRIEGDGLTVDLARAVADGPRRATILARNEAGQILGRESVDFGPEEPGRSAVIDLPAELRNKVTRVDIAEEASAAATHLLDGRWRRRLVGIAFEGGDEALKPLVSEAFYLERALSPFADIRRAPLADLLKAPPSVIILTDVGQVPAATRPALETYIEKGGVLLRFAGPRFAASADDLLPVRIRQGDRALGGSLSWTEPAPIAPFPPDSPFAGLVPGPDVRVRRQVLAEPSLDLDRKTWARLADGTPLITGARRGSGLIVLIHTSANSDWSDLALSGLFVDLLRRITGLADGEATLAESERSLPPFASLDGFGRLGGPMPGAGAIAADAFAATVPGPRTPPGYYGDAVARRALNLQVELEALAPLPAMAGVTVALPETAPARPFGPWLLVAALLLIAADLLIALRLSGRLVPTALGALALAVGMQMPQPARAIEAADAAGTIRLGFVITGDGTVDDLSEAGLRSLSAALAQRTSVEPGEPVAINLEADDLAFYPLIYWPMAEGYDPGPVAMERVDHYLKSGGVVLFDTRDITQGAGDIPGLGASAGELLLRRTLARLDVPALVPVPADHVLTKSFYLLQSFPGRYEGGTLWVEANASPENDGVSGYVVGSNDWAAAWALDAQGRPLAALEPDSPRQREMALRFGINLVLYALTGNYKADQVHVPALLERLGQ
ncbi:DUF4159 domain-containing protein [Zavarzinia compransoris]|uniref:LytTR family transcriptional regulator n=1 Tax=Zavarzinia compransoris TaxID=1264899 RepID=A0A317E980_9PROT|nr:DUF4159 domain-containing protein [Zavarzinia compransoris]PWR23281.1 hypothetical protein DKG75_01545 [Zavarzinia compransoris]TDP46151.1 putative membrane protein (TIGR02226 family) [Zavarzinia compransoris]